MICFKCEKEFDEKETKVCNICFSFVCPYCNEHLAGNCDLNKDLQKGERKCGDVNDAIVK
jgi:hypothetical protein